VWQSEVVDIQKIAEAVWSYPNRTLTSLAGQPRVDLLGEDRDFEEGTGYRKRLVERIADALVLYSTLESAARFYTTDTYPKTVSLVDTSGQAVSGSHHLVEGVIDLSDLGSSETVVVEEYVMLAPGGQYRLYSSESFTGPLSKPAILVRTAPVRGGVKVLLRMDQAPAENRSFPYIMFVKSVAKAFPV